MAKYCQSRVHMHGWISDNNLSLSQSFCIHKWNLRGETKLPVIIEVKISSPGFFQYYFRFLPVSSFLQVKSISKQRWCKRSTHRKFPLSIWENDVKQVGTDLGFMFAGSSGKRGNTYFHRVFFFWPKKSFRSISGHIFSWHQTQAEISERVAHSIFYLKRSI